VEKRFLRLKKKTAIHLSLWEEWDPPHITPRFYRINHHPVQRTITQLQTIQDSIYIEFLQGYYDIITKARTGLKYIEQACTQEQLRPMLHRHRRMDRYLNFMFTLERAQKHAQYMGDIFRIKGEKVAKLQEDINEAFACKCCFINTALSRMGDDKIITKFNLQWQIPPHRPFPLRR
jgi:hypothetical protein